MPEWTPGPGPTDGDDIFDGNADRAVSGNGGNDLMRGGPLNAFLYGGSGDDTIYAHPSGYPGGSGIVLAGEDGSDRLHGGPGGDFIYGGPPDNSYGRFEYDRSDDGSADYLYGFGGDDYLFGGEGPDFIDGGDGSDRIFPGLGADQIFGGDGVDTVDFGPSFGANDFTVNANLSTGFLEIDGLRGSMDSVENFIGGNANDTIIGNEENNNLLGGPGADLIFGGDGNDNLYGGGGADILYGGPGADLFDGGEFIGDRQFLDTVSYEYAISYVVVFMGNPIFNTGEAFGDVFREAWPIERVIGSTFADILGGDQNDNTLDGGGGNDWLLGGAGDDTLIGGEGNNILAGGLGADALDGSAGANDTAYYREASEGVSVDLANPANNAGEALGDTFIGIEHVWASDFNDTVTHSDAGGQVYGFDGDDSLNGGGGGDVFYGGRGADTLTLGDGADFMFLLRWDGDQAEQADRIIGFEPGTDAMVLSRFWFGFGNIQGVAAALTEGDAGWYAADERGFATFTDTRPSFVYNQFTGVLLFDPDGLGLSPAFVLATFDARTPLTLDDIWTA